MGNMRNEKGQFMKGDIKDITGKKIGHLTALRFDHMKGKKSYWEFKCICGNTCIKRSDCLNEDSSCGCWTKKRKSELMNERHSNDEHHDSKTRFYSIWNGAKTRCTNSNDSHYYLYGGRGIKFEWVSYIDFKKDMYESYLQACKLYGEENVSIERLNVNGNYCKTNCKWIHIKQQAKNRRTNVIVEMNDGTEMILSDYADMVNVKRSTMNGRYRRSKYNGTKRIPEDALKTTPR